MGVVKEPSELEARVAALEARVAAIEEKQPKVIEYPILPSATTHTLGEKPKKARRATK